MLHLLYVRVYSYFNPNKVGFVVPRFQVPVYVITIEERGFGHTTHENTRQRGRQENHQRERQAYLILRGAAPGDHS